MRKLLAILFLLATHAFAQNAIYVLPPTPRTPVGGIQSITAVVTGNANKSVNWSTTCGTLIGSGNTVGLKSSSTGTCTVTAIMAADGVTSASSTVTFEAVHPDLQAASVHPRIGLTAADVSDLQTKATNAGNKAYTVGLQTYFANAQTYYNAHFCWAGGGCGAVGPIGTIDPTTGWIDTNNTFIATGGGPFEYDTALYALMALIDPTTGNRATWAAHAHDLAMWEWNEVCYNAFSGSGACLARNYGTPFTPFIGSQFILNNRAQNEALPMMQAVDWNYSSFTSGDKAIIAKMGHIWGQQLTGASSNDWTSGGNDHVTPIGAYNTSTIISGSVEQVEGGANNYAEGRTQSMALIGLLLDPGDDPAISSCASSTTTICASDGSAKTVGAYAVYAVKGSLYRLYANFEDQHIVDAAYGLSDPFTCPDIQVGTATCTGRMSGGYTAEGTGYGQISMTAMFNTIYALYTAGKLNPATDPQASFISSSFWDKLVLSYVAQLYPATGTYGGPYTQFGSDYAYSIVQSTALEAMEIYDAKYGSTWRKDIDKWYLYNVQYASSIQYGYRFLQGQIGGALYAPNTMQATSATNDGDFDSSGNITPGEYDPRNTSTLPLDFENISSSGGFYRYYGRNNWSTTATQFQFGCSSAAIDHAMSACGRFDFLRNGEPLITALGGTSNSDDYAQAPQHQNIPGYQYNPSFNCTGASVSHGICEQGGMMDNSWAASSNILLATSSNATYYYGATDSTGSSITAISPTTAANSANVNLSQREVLWLKPDAIWVYDRVNAKSSTSFKNFYLDLRTSPTISGNQATMTSRKGQKLFVTVLLPRSQSISASALDNQHERDAPVAALLSSEGGTARMTRMLHVIEGKNSGSASPTSLVQSSVGTGYDGGIIGNTVVMFKRTLADTFLSTTYAASGATKHYITGLMPNGAYSISATGAPASAIADSGGVITFAAAGKGTVTVKATVVARFPAQDEHTGLAGRSTKWRFIGARQFRWIGLSFLLATCLGFLWVGISGRGPKLFLRN